MTLEQYITLANAAYKAPTRNYYKIMQKADNILRNKQSKYCRPQETSQALLKILYAKHPKALLH